MYDTIEVKCLSCGKLTYPQTKCMGDETLQILKKGDKIDSDVIKDCNLELKNRCEHCKASLVLEIKSGTILDLTKEEPTMREELWGKLVTLKQGIEK